MNLLAGSQRSHRRTERASEFTRRSLVLHAVVVPFKDWAIVENVAAVGHPFIETVPSRTDRLRSSHEDHARVGASQKDLHAELPGRGEIRAYCDAAVVAALFRLGHRGVIEGDPECQVCGDRVAPAPVVKTTPGFGDA